MNISAGPQAQCWELCAKLCISYLPEQESPLEKAVRLPSPTPSLAGRKLAMLIEHLREKKKIEKEESSQTKYINWQFKQDFSFPFFFFF